MEKKLIRKCPICNSDSGEILHHQSFADLDMYELPKDYDIVCCHRCGFVFADTQASQQDYSRYYQEFSKYESGGTPVWTTEKMKPLSKFLPDKEASILDIGCANGELLVELKKIGYKNLTGLDPAKVCVQNARNNEIDTVEGELFSINSVIPDKKFDCIVLSHVLEHIRDLEKAADIMSNNLNDGGVLYIEVPDASRYSEFFIVPYYFFDTEHINHFDENSLNNLFLQKGFDLLQYEKKVINQMDSNKLYPIVYAIYKKTNKKENIKNIVKNLKVRDSVLAHIKESEEKSKWPEIDRIANSKEKIVVWGAGSHALRLLNNSSLSKCNIEFFIDKDPKKQGMKMKNIPIYSSEKLKMHKGPVVVCSALYSDDIAKEIKNMGAENIIIVMK
ncbi:MAG: methyltransferase domain-containing protein [Patescibacteria group bacterium]